MNTTVHLPQPALFLSHGSPMIALQPGAAGLFMQRLGDQLREQFGLPRAILALSAHTLARELTLLAAPQHHTVYDFGRFDDRLFELRYDASGEPALASSVAQRLQQAGLPAGVVSAGGLDHGNWTVLRYLFPQANVPILPLAWQPSGDPTQQFKVGQALSPFLDDGVLILASGSITHNLGRVFSKGMNAPVDQVETSESRAFRLWMFEKSRARDWAALLDARKQAPHYQDMHPSDEHLLPWFIAAGAGGADHTPQRLHESVTYGCLGMDAYAFGSHAAQLAQIVARE
jgi:4,5-DOPA dioxygenase extradiol